MAGEEILAALQGVQSSPLENYYGMGSTVLGASTPKMINPYGSVGSNLAIALGSVLGQTLLTNFAQEEAAKRSLADAKLAVSLQGLGAAERLGQIENADIGGLRQQRLITLSNALNSQELANRQQKAQQEELARVGVEKALAEKFGVPYGEGVDAARQLRESMKTGRMDVGATPSKYGAGESLTQRKQKLVQSYIAQGMTANAAGMQAEKDIQFQKGMNENALKTIEKSRQAADAMGSVSATARTALTGAGETGGAIGGLREMASKAYALISPEEQQQRDAQKLYDTIKPNLVLMNKSPGAISDAENKMLIGSGPSPANTPSENEVIINNMEMRADLESQYANFLEDYINDTGSSVGAQRIWDTYKKETVFANGQINYDYPRFEDWWSVKTEGGATPTAAATELTDEQVMQQIQDIQRQIAEEQAKRGM